MTEGKRRRTSVKHRGQRYLAFGLIALGGLLFLTASGYLAYAWFARERLGSLVYVPPPPAGAVSMAPRPLTLEWLRPEDTAPPAGAGLAGQHLYPGEMLPFYSWARPWAVDVASVALGAGAEGYVPIDQFALGKLGTLPSATRILIPAIELEAEVRDLAILNLGDERAYETPDHVVGHIPGTANPGEVGNNWLFGHLASIVRGEGSVFESLPKIPGILRTGQRVYVVLESPAGSYLYEAVETRVIPGEELHVYSSEQATITLVTCVPKLTYEYRLLVTARLVGYQAPGEQTPPSARG